MTRSEFVHGIDASRWQGEIDWDLVASRGAILDPAGRVADVDLVVAKGSEDQDGTYATAKAHAEGIKRTRLRRCWGVYHFARMDTGGTLDPILEAMANLEALELMGAQDAKVIALDLEKVDAVRKHLTRDEAIVWVWAWLGYVDAHTWPQLAVYGRRLPKWLKAPGLDAYPLWVPRYDAVSGVHTGAKMGLPGELPEPWDEWWIHQYTSQGRVKGIDGNVDLNVMRRRDYRRLLNMRRAMPLIA